MASDKVATGIVINAELSAVDGITAIVSTRIYPNKAPQGALAPFIVYSIVSEIPENSLNGLTATSTSESRVQLDCYSKRYLEAHQIALLVEETLSDINRSDFGAWKTNQRDLYDDEAGLHRVSIDMSVWR